MKAVIDLDQVRVAVIGLGYVGLPLAVEFGKQYQTLGYDLSPERVAELRAGHDRTGEVDDLSVAPHLAYSSDVEDLRDCSIYVIAVPTPIDANHMPDLEPLRHASATVGKVIAAGDVVIYESTVYPGATEEDCIPVIEEVSGLRFNQDFFAGYSPERINPGDKARPITSIVKITSGSTPEIAGLVDRLYASIIPAGTFRAASIRVAEAAKVTENIQRDVNIALINELSMVFARLGIDTSEVIEAAATKWNFMRLSPGLVGGHCIGVDPYYLLHRSERAGHIPDIIRRSREINNAMPREAARRMINLMIRRDLPVNTARVMIMGATFKEDCPDIRNTKIISFMAALREWGVEAELADPHADPAELQAEYGVSLTAPEAGTYDALVLAVPHSAYVDQGIDGLRRYLRPNGIFFDMKAAFDRSESDLRL